MRNYKSPQSIIDTYKRRQRRLPLIIGVLSAILVLGGITLIVLSFTGGSASLPSIGFLSTKTLTPTLTLTPTPIPPTLTPTLTTTPTLTPTVTITPTANAPFEYTVQEGDNCWDIAVQFEVSLAVLQAINNFGGGCPINPGDVILIPPPGAELPTMTPIPDDLPRGTEIEYIVQANDSLSGIAEKFNSLLSVIMELNELENANAIFIGQKLIIPVNLPTATPEA
jgi:LysM repeat protein